MTAREHHQPTLEQIDQIRRLATVVIGEGGADQLFAEAGYPQSGVEASDYIGALHKIRNQRRGPDDPDERRDAVVDHIKTSRTDTSPQPETPPEPEEELMPEDTKECSNCGETKPLTDFYKNRRSSDGHASACKACFKEKYGSGSRDPASAANKKKVAARSKQKTPKASSTGPNEEQTEAGGGDSAPAEPSLPTPPGITPPLSEHNGDWRQQFRDPRLSQLRDLQAILGNSEFDLEATAEISQAIAALEWE